MPLVQHSKLPSLSALKDQGHEVLSLDRACHQDIRELHIGLLNMMPDAALQVTERQYLRLVGGCNQIAQFFVHPFTIPGLPRGPEAQAYIDRYYLDFESIQAQGLDALIITGANVTQPELDKEPFWAPLAEVTHWALESVTSTMCSCLATHALLQQLYGVKRKPLPAKRWGVYPHLSSRVFHPLLRNINTLFDVPHSRWNTISIDELRQVEVIPLIQSQQDDLHLAVSPDGIRLVFSQGHPEYDTNSLLKEYKREVLRFNNGERDSYPPHPENYFCPQAAAIANEYEDGNREAPFPERELERYLHNTWGDTGRGVFNNWLGTVYQVTHLDRKLPFRDEIDPEDPLGLRQQKDRRKAT